MPHIHEKIDFTVSVYVVFEDKVLLRLHEKYHCWFPVGGHIELDEDANAAALREVKEEVGLEVELIAPPHAQPLPNSDTGGYRELIPPHFLNIHAINETHQHHDFTYFAKSISDDVKPENNDDQWLWLTRDELLAHADIEERIKSYALAALEAAGT